MKHYLFTITLSGDGDNPDDAWEDVVESFTQDPGTTPDKSEYTVEDVVEEERDKTMENHILTKEHREAGLDTHEDDHNLYITDTATGETVAILGNHATIKEIHIAANYYLIQKAKGSHGNA